MARNQPNHGCNRVHVLRDMWRQGEPCPTCREERDKTPTGPSRENTPRPEKQQREKMKKDDEEKEKDKGEEEGKVKGRS
jgi:hypothetical protein